jgi:hypothetical protein
MALDTSDAFPPEVDLFLDDVIRAYQNRRRDPDAAGANPNPKGRHDGFSGSV